MATNRNFVYVDENGVFTYAQTPLEYGGHLYGNPKEPHYRAAGAYPFTDERPATDETHYAVGTKYADIVDGVAVRRYEVRERPPVVNRYEKVRLYVGLVRIGKWAAFEEWAAEQTIPEGDYAGVNLLTAFNCVVVIRDDHPLFAHYYGAIKTALGIDDATAQAVLDAAKEA